MVEATLLFDIVFITNSTIFRWNRSSASRNAAFENPMLRAAFLALTMDFLVCGNPIALHL
jgi:hypothetical protein